MIEKDEQAGRNIGDPSEFLGVYSVEEEEAIVAQAMEQEPKHSDPNDISALFEDILGDNAAAESGLNPFVPERPVTQPADLQHATARTRFLLDGRKIANPAVVGDVSDLKAMLPAVVDHVRDSLKAQRDKLQAGRLEKLNRHLASLSALRGKHLAQLELDLAQSDQPTVFKEKRKQDRGHHIERVFNEYQQWIEDTQRTEDDPYIQIIAVFTGRAA